MRAGIDYTETELGEYRVVVFDEKGKRVGKATREAFTRRGAYFDCMGEMPPHRTWNAWRVRNVEPPERTGE